MSGTATLGYVLAVLMPLIGFFVGVALIARGDRHGGGVLVTSIAIFFLFIVLISS